MTAPVVTVFIPTYNAAAHIGQAIESVVTQTYRDFELLLIDDGSGDATREIAAAWAARDPRIQVVSRENRGRPATRNEGFDRARGRFLAVLDADDLCAPRRLEFQVAFMEAHPDVALCGSRTIHFQNVAEIAHAAPSLSILRKHPVDPAGVRASQLFECAVRQSTAMFRMDTVRARGYRYNPEYPVAEDFELFNRIVADGPVTNLPEVLVYYRRHEHQSTHLQATQVQVRMANAARETWSSYGVATASIEDQAKLMRPELFARLRELPGVARSYRRLLTAAEQRGGIDTDVLKDHQRMHLRRALKRRFRLHAPIAVPASPSP